MTKATPPIPDLKEELILGLVAPTRNLEDILPNVQPKRNVVCIDPFTVPKSFRGQGVLALPENTVQGVVSVVGRVFAVGPGTDYMKCDDCGGRFTAPSDVQVGDYVVYDRRAPLYHNVQGKDGEFYNVAFLQDDLVLATIQKPTK